MEWTLDDLSNLNDAIKTGARKVKYADKEVEYRDLDEMLRIQKAMKDALGLNSPGRERVFASHSKGLD